MDPLRSAQFASSAPLELKQSNRSQILHAFFKGGALSVNDVALSVGLSRQTVMKSIQFFLQQGLLISTGKGQSTEIGGKRPELFSLPPDKYFLCIALWPDILGIRLYTLSGKIVDSTILNIVLPGDPTTAVDMACEFVNEIIVAKVIDKRQIISVHISTSGIVDQENGVLKYCALTPNWGSDVPLAKYFRPHFAASTKILLASAVTTMAYPFLWDPKYAGKRVLTMFTSWIVASSFIENNRIFLGRNALIGELGHMIVDPNDPEVCGCGSCGCLERMIDEKHITKLMLENKEQYPNSPLFHVPAGKITIPTIFFFSQQEDPLSQIIVEYLARHFAVALRNVAIAFDPDFVVFLGDYTCANSYFDLQLQKNLMAFRYFHAEKPFETVYDVRHPVEMGIYGTYLMLVEDYVYDSTRSL